MWENTTNVFQNCNPESNNFNYGLFENAVTENVVFSNFIEKYFYCLWWGLQNLRYNFFFNLVEPKLQFYRND